MFHMIDFSSIFLIGEKYSREKRINEYINIQARFKRFLILASYILPSSSQREAERKKPNSLCRSDERLKTVLSV